MIFNNILIVRTDRIGDVVLTTPAIKALRQAYPVARISVLASQSTCELLDGNPYLDEVLVDDRKGRHKGLFGFLRLARELRLKQFDLAVIFHTKRRYNLLSFLAGIPCRLGYKNEKFGFLLTHPLKDTRPSGQKHEALYCMDLLKAIGIDGGGLDLFVPVQKCAEDWAVQWMSENGLRSHGFIVIHPGASDPAKCWPAANFSQLINALALAHPFKVVLIGSQQSAALSAQVLQGCSSPSGILNLTGKTSLPQMASLLRRARLLISNDSGPVHVAAAVGCSVISIFLRDSPGINPQRWRPLGPKGFMLHNKPLPVPVEEVLKLSDQIFKWDSQYEIF